MFRTDLAYDNWKKKYRYANESPLETFQRVAKALSSVEKQEDQEIWYERFLRTLVKFDPDGNPVGLKCTTGGRITANIGTAFSRATPINCFVSGPVKKAKIHYQRKSEIGDVSYDVDYETDDNPDDLINIFLTLLEQAKTLASEGGYGLNFGFIRPRSSIIRGTGILHPGVLSYMKIWDSVSECIVKGTNDGYVDKLVNYLKSDAEIEEMKATLKSVTRKGAMLACLPVWHPDIEEFVRAKQTPGVLTKFNISVLIDDSFMKAVEQDELYELHFNKTPYKAVKARALYDLIMESCYNRGEPGVLFYDNMQKNNPLAYLGNLICTNPCGEVTGLASLTTVCLLGSPNLTQYVQIDDKGDPFFNEEEYKEDVAVFTRMLDNVNDIGYTPLPPYTWAMKNLRQIGMGLNGVGSTLMMLGIPYNSQKAISFVEHLCKLKEDITWQTSAMLAKEKGVFPAYSKEGFENTEFFKSDRLSPETKKMLRKYGARNGKTTTNPPLGNCLVGSTKVQTSEGIKKISEIFRENIRDISPLKEKVWYIPLKTLYAKTLEGFKRITGLYYNGMSTTFLLKGSEGQKIEGTSEHKVLVRKGKTIACWKKLSEIKIGDKIVVQNPSI